MSDIKTNFGTVGDDYTPTRAVIGSRETNFATAKKYTDIDGIPITKAEHLTGRGMSQVSDFRNSQLNFDTREERMNRNAEVISGQKQSLIKTASQSNSMDSIHIAGRGNSTHIATNFYSPFFLTANLQLPRDRITGNAWNRAFYETHPVVRNGINLHATYPISKLNIRCEDKNVERFFNEMMDEIDLFTVVQNIALEYWKIGEVFVYADLDESSRKWKRIYIQNPDYISVEKTEIPGEFVIALKPDPTLQNIVSSNDPKYQKLRSRLDPSIVDAVARNEYIPMDDFNISHLKNLTAGYAHRGTSIIASVWKDLVLYDLLRESKYVQADAMVNPMTLVKLGQSGPEGHYPRPEELENLRSVFETAQYDKDFKIFSHPDLTIERVGYNGGILDVSGDFQFILDNILMGLGIPKSVLVQEGATYSSASVGLDVMRQRYMNFRSMMANWLTKKIFAPISELNDFYEIKGGEKHLIVPSVEWNHITLQDTNDYIGHLMSLHDKQFTPTIGAVSKTAIYRSLGLDMEEELSNMKEEARRMIIVQKEIEEMQKMSLSSLRALDTEEAIVESEDEPLPGTSLSEVQEVADSGLDSAMQEASSPDMGIPDFGNLGGEPTPEPDMG